ncbi:MAG: c-type cytochrome [Betaproteobacteria bacterium]|nr:c-type cytochrome [Betaproteobacteria bacterium]
MKTSSFAFSVAALLATPLCSDALAADAAETYHQFCSVCHGDRGDGQSRARQGLKPPPRDFTVPGMAEALSRARMIDAVMNGRPGTAMVGWKTRFTAAQAEALVDYIRATFMHRASPAAAATVAETKAVPYVPSPKGKASNGKSLYENNCSTCHGMSGAGDGPRAYFIFPKPRDFTSEQVRSTFTPDTLFVAVKHGVQGREMPAWGKVLSDQQIADVSQYVYDTFVHRP